MNHASANQPLSDSPTEQRERQDSRLTAAGRCLQKKAPEKSGAFLFS